VKDPAFAKFVLFVNGLVPAALLAWAADHHQLGADPIGYCIDTTGFIALTFLLLTLLVTPLRKLTGYNFLSHFRRMLGLFAFFYALCHFSIYFFIEQHYNFTQAFTNVLKNYFILLGLTSLVVMIPLAITSTAGMVRRLGAKRWKALHRLTYVAAIAGVLHYFYRFKTPHELPIIFGVMLAVLLLARIVPMKKSAKRGPISR
jgi:sulfoxide reductase heme-binding subunit YedZ